MEKNHISGNGENEDVGGHEGRSLAEENEKLKARIVELETLVRRDTLTPLYNRRHFMDVLDRWSWRAHRYGGDYALLFADVDQLKAVNDSHGHDAGDKMLIAISRTLQSCVRKSDLVARMGGDEFGMLLENIKASELPGKVERIRKSVAREIIDYQGKKLRPSISIGYAVLEGGISPEELLLRADRSMYKAKDS